MGDRDVGRSSPNPKSRYDEVRASDTPRLIFDPAGRFDALMDDTGVVEVCDAPPLVAEAASIRSGSGSDRTVFVQGRRRGRPLLWIVGLALCAFAAAFAAAPFAAYWAIRSAARYDDSAALAQLIDYDQVRASLKPQLIDPVGVRAAPPRPNLLNDPIGAIRDLWARRAWAPEVIRAPSPDAYLSPDALLRVLGGGADARQPPGRRDRASKVTPPLPTLAFFGAHRVRFVVKDPADPRRETVLTMARGDAWFTWRLVGIGLPNPGS